MEELELLQRLQEIEEALREGQSHNYCRDLVSKLILDRWGPNSVATE